MRTMQEHREVRARWPMDERELTRVIAREWDDTANPGRGRQRAGANLVVEKNAVDEQLTRAIRDLWKEG